MNRKKILTTVAARMVLSAASYLLPGSTGWAGNSYRLEDFRVRDPFIVNVGGERPYLLFMSDSWRKTGRGSADWCAPGIQSVSVSRSADLVRWSEPETCMIAPEWCWQIWAPEIHEWKGKWYMFVTLKERPGHGEPIRSMVPGEPDWEYNRGSRTNSTCHALWMYRADRPEGPYLPIVDKPLTEKGYISLDGTLGVEDGKPWMIYTHDWAQVRVGTYELRPLSDDLTHFIGPAKTLFTAAEMPMCRGMGVTDGAFLYRSPKSGKFFMTWSTHDPSRTPGHDYCVVLCESATGRLAGPWVNHHYLSSDASGHGHFFRDKDGRLRFVMHYENPTDEHVRIFEVIDDGDTLRFGPELAGTHSASEKNSALDVRATDFPSVSAAIAACAEKGGGRVVVPPGHWRTGAVRLRSNCELHLAEGAVLEFTDDLDDYLPGVPVTWEGIECVNVSSLVYAYGCTNVAITGRGTLKANMDFWWTWAGVRKPDCEAVNRKLKNEWSPQNVPIAERQLWKEPNARFRPQFLHFNRCKDVRLEGVSIRGTPFWTVHFFLCDGVVARDLDIDATGDDGRLINNSDGMDIDASRNVLVERCVFCQGDDALVFKSGKDFDGRRLATPTENVVVRGCTVRRGNNLAAIGSELSGGVRNIRISGCRITGVVGELLHVKTNPRRGGFVENVVIEDVEADELKTDVLGITSRYYYGAPGEEALDRDYLTPIRNIVLRDIRCRKAPRCLTVRGDSLLPVENVALSNVRIGSCTGSDQVENVRNLTVDGQSVSPKADGR